MITIVLNDLFENIRKGPEGKANFYPFEKNLDIFHVLIIYF